MVQLSQFRCQVLNTAGFYPEKAQAQSHSPPHAGQTRSAHACKLEADIAKAHSEPKTRNQKRRGPAGSDSQCVLPPAEPQGWALAHWPSVQAQSDQRAQRRAKELGCLPGPGHVRATLCLCFLLFSFWGKISWRNPHVSTRQEPRQPEARGSREARNHTLQRHRNRQTQPHRGLTLWNQSPSMLLLPVVGLPQTPHLQF